MLITILGPDGTGKTTLAKLISKKYKNIDYVYFGNNIENRKYKYFTKFLCSQRNGKLNTLLKYIFIFINDLYYYRLSKNKNIISDRCTIDKYLGAIIQNDKYRKLFHMFTLYFFPKSSFILLLEGNPEIIFNRKKEISISMIKKYILLCREYLKKNHLNFVCIYTTIMGIEKTLSMAVSEINDRYEI